MFNVKVSKLKLGIGNTKVPYMTRKLSSTVLSKVIDMSCLQSGTAIDLYSCTM